MSAVRWPAMLLVAAASVAVAAPVPKELKAPPGSYFPTAVGTRWEYVVQGTDKLDHTREVATEEIEKDGTRVVEFKWTSHGASYTAGSVYRVDAKQVARTGWSKGQPFQTPCVLWKGDAKTGDSWNGGIVGAGEAAQFEMIRGTEAEVTTPAGKFRAVPITFQTVNNKADANTYWYAPGVGLVKWESGGKTIVLSKFTAGKEARK